MRRYAHPSKMMLPGHLIRSGKGHPTGILPVCDSPAEFRRQSKRIHRQLRLRKLEDRKREMNARKSK